MLLERFNHQSVLIPLRCIPMAVLRFLRLLVRIQAFFIPMAVKDSASIHRVAWVSETQAQPRSYAFVLLLEQKQTSFLKGITAQVVVSLYFIMPPIAACGTVQTQA